jgi:hypothetical protein
MTSVVSLSPSLATLDALARQVAEEGVDSDRAQVVSVVRAAMATGASPVLAEVVTDPREPEVARQRAFGRLLGHLGLGTSTVSAPADSASSPSRQPVWPVHVG